MRSSATSRRRVLAHALPQLGSLAMRVRHAVQCLRHDAFVERKCPQPCNTERANPRSKTANAQGKRTGVPPGWGVPLWWQCCHTMMLTGAYRSAASSAASSAAAAAGASLPRAGPCWALPAALRSASSARTAAVSRAALSTASPKLARRRSRSAPASPSRRLGAQTLRFVRVAKSPQV